MTLAKFRPIESLKDLVGYTPLRYSAEEIPEQIIFKRKDRELSLSYSSFQILSKYYRPAEEGKGDVNIHVDNLVRKVNSLIPKGQRINTPSANHFKELYWKKGRFNTYLISQLITELKIDENSAIKAFNEAIYREIICCKPVKRDENNPNSKTYLKYFLNKSSIVVL